jgi:hypothetical protein
VVLACNPTAGDDKTLTTGGTFGVFDTFFVVAIVGPTSPVGAAIAYAIENVPAGSDADTVLMMNTCVVGAGN